MKQLEEELLKLKTDFECLEMIHNSSSCDCSNVVKESNGENFEIYKER